MLIRPVLFCHFCARPIGRLNQLTGWHLCRLFCVFANLPKFVHSPSYWYYFYKILQIVIYKVISFLGPGAVFLCASKRPFFCKGRFGPFYTPLFWHCTPCGTKQGFLHGLGINPFILGLCVPNCCFLTGCTGTAFAASFMKTRPQNCLCSKPCPYLKGMPLLWLLPAAFAGNPRLFFLLTAHKPKHRHSPLQQTPKFAQSAISLAYFRLITDLFCGLF